MHSAEQGLIKIFMYVIYILYILLQNIFKCNTLLVCNFFCNNFHIIKF